MKIFIVVLLMMCSAGIFAQSAADTIYYDKDWKKTYGPDYAFYRVVTPEGEKLHVLDHYRSGHVQMSGSFISLAPKEIEDGHFLYYTDAGVKTRDEYYKAGLLEGEYLTYDTAGHLILKMYFKHDKWDGRRTAYYPTGVVYRDEIYKEGNFISGHVYDENGKEVPFYPREQMPEFPGGDTAMAAFIHDHLRYPSTARNMNIEGVVVVKFIVGTDGSIEDVSVVKSDAVLLNDAAMDVVSKLPKFKPGQQEGKLVRVAFNLPIRFRLTDPDKKAK